MSQLNHIPAWQQIVNSVTDVQVYPFLCRLAVVGNRLNEENALRSAAALKPQLQEEEEDQISVGRIPRGSIKALRAYFKLLALDKQGDPVDAPLKRTYLAFYAQLLEMKSGNREEQEDLSQRPELLIAKFLAIVSKLAGASEVTKQGYQFVALLRSVVRKQGGSSALDAQLAARQEQLKNLPQKAPQSEERLIPADADNVTSQVANVMLVSPVLFEQDLARESSISLREVAFSFERLVIGLTKGLHPIYTPKDFKTASEWERWSDAEKLDIQHLNSYLLKYHGAGDGTVDMIPERVRSYFTLLLRRCIEFDKKGTTLFSNKTRQLLRFCARHWRVSARAYATCLLHAANYLYEHDDIELSKVTLAYSFAKEHLLSLQKGVWAQSDQDQLINELIETSNLALDKIKDILSTLFNSTKPEKIGPYIQVVDEVVPSLYRQAFPGTDSLGNISSAKIDEFVAAIRNGAAADYDKLVSMIPRDDTLQVEHISNMIHTVIDLAKSLQKRYKRPLFDVISIAPLACSEQLKLLSSDFVPLWKYCMRQYELRKSEPPFDVMQNLHEELLLLQDLYGQVHMNEPLSFDVEDLLFPYFQNWALEAASLAKDWVKPAAEQDDSQPVDIETGKWYSSVIKDLFRSFYSLLKLIDGLRWHNKSHIARLLTIVIEGVSETISEWASQTQVEFYNELQEATAGMSSGRAAANQILTQKVLRVKDQNEEWLAYAKDTTANARAAVLASRLIPQPDPFEFKRESGIKINNIDAAYEQLNEMETSLNSDQVSHNLSSASKQLPRDRKQPTSYLFTVTIISATDVNSSQRGLYVTLMDQDTRKVLGKTRTAIPGSRLTAWNEPIELQVGRSSRLLRATLWSASEPGNHELKGRTMIRLDPGNFSRKEYGMQLKSLELDPAPGKLQVMITVDAMQDDIRFHFGKALRHLMRIRESLIASVVEQFSAFIYQIISRQTLRQIQGGNALANVQSSVSQLQKSFNTWLGKSVGGETETASSSAVVVTPQQVYEDSLNPLFEYMNRNFATLAQILTPALRKEVLAKTWDVVLEALELLIIPPLYSSNTTQASLSSVDMEIVYTWISCLRDFFYSDGAGPDLERLQNSNYQLVMTIPVYYDLPTSQLKQESEKLARSSSGAVASSNELLARQRTVMAHRNKSVIEHQTVQIKKAQETAPRLDDVVLRILRLRNEGKFIDQHLRYRERLLQREITERVLQGSIH